MTTTDTRRRKSRRFREEPTPGPTAVEVAANFSGYRLRQAREELAGLSRRDLAPLVGVTPARICLWESQAAAIRAYEVEKLSEVLDYPVPFFAHGRPMVIIDSADVFFCEGGSTRRANARAELNEHIQGAV